MYKSLPLLSLLLLLAGPLQALEQVDPMRPDDQAGTTSTGTPAASSVSTRPPARIELWVQSIQIGAEERSATINGRLLKVGDRIAGAQLLSIEHNQVRLKRGKEVIELMFLPRAIKR